MTLVETRVQFIYFTFPVAMFTASMPSSVDSQYIQ